MKKLLDPVQTVLDANTQLVVAVGTPGGGKSFFTRAFVDRFPSWQMLSIDDVFKRPELKDLSLTDKEDYLWAEFYRLLGQGKLIVDGGHPISFKAFLDLRIGRADVAFFFNPPIQECVDAVRNRGISGEESPNGLTTEELVKHQVLSLYDYHDHTMTTKEALTTLGKGGYHTFCSRKETEAFLQALDARRAGQAEKTNLTVLFPEKTDTKPFTPFTCRIVRDLKDNLPRAS